MMRTTRAARAVLIAAVAAGPVTRAAEPPARCALRVELVDAVTEKRLPGLIRIATDNGEAVTIEELLSRGHGLGGNSPLRRWWVLPEPTSVAVPAGRLVLEAFSGLETEIARREVDLTGKRQATVQIALRRFYRPATHDYRSANTHLHLRKMRKSLAFRYLREIPAADGLDVLYVSHLERAGDDQDYITNHFTADDLAALSKGPVLFGNGQEHRHNLTAWDEGYGHVMLLNIPHLFHPVSLGPGITKTGTDGVPLRRAIDRARSAKATIVWCHNDWGFEDVPNWLTGRLDAQNIFDGGTHGSYAQSFYRYLSAGLRVPFSTGTDWFIYDFSRVYVKMTEPLTSASWLKALAAGRSYITNGPFLEFEVNGKEAGSTIALDAPGAVRVRARAVGRADFKTIELLRNGRVIASAASASAHAPAHFTAQLETALRLDAPCWLAVRVPPVPVEGERLVPGPAFPRNALGQPIFAHTSAVYVDVGGKHVFDRAVAQELLADMTAAQTAIKENYRFASDAERSRVLAVYADAIEQLRRRLTGNDGS